ncbi:MAG: hypothetical protein LBH00_11425 [Planctomycetaceae bacterium]|nr:hypothetical protein [Planctomycetaceae bacterium]
MKYLLPCDCGRNIEIVPGQAGQSVVCSCGKTQTAPTMRHIKELPHAGSAASSERTPQEQTGILRKTFFIIGIVLLIPSAAFCVYLCLTTPHPRQVMDKRVTFSFGSGKELYQNSTPIPQSEGLILYMTDEAIDQMAPMQLFFYFQTLKEPTFSFNFQDNYQAVKDSYRIKVIAAVILLFLAVSSITASFFMPKKNVIITGYSGNDWR